MAAAAAADGAEDAAAALELEDEEDEEEDEEEELDMVVRSGLGRALRTGRGRICPFPGFGWRDQISVWVSGGPTPQLAARRIPPKTRPTSAFACDVHQ